MKKIIGLAIAGILVLAMVAGGTMAYFQDTETSSANSILAGKLDLKLNTADANVNLIAALTGRKPGDADKAPGQYVSLSNSGNLTGGLSITIGTVTNSENYDANADDAESDDDADTSDATGGGELGAKVQIAPWIDLNSNGTFDAGSDIALTSAGGVSTAALQWATVDAFADNATYSNVIASFTSSTTARFYLPWDFVEPGSKDNSAQGDGFSFGITYSLRQLTTASTAAIVGVTAPVTGASPVTAITAATDYTGTVTWAPVDDPFVISTVYTATITLTATSGYTLTGVPANFFTVAGATTVTNSADSGVITAVFPATS